MAIGVGNLVSSADYNAIVNTIRKVLGDDGSNEQVGYGRTPLSSTVSAGDVIDADLMDNLYSDLVRARTHQKGSSFSWDTSADGLNAPDAGEYIGAFAADLGAGGTSADATVDEAEGFLDFSQAAADIDADKYDVGSDQTSIEVIETSTRTSAWNGTITHTVDVVWANANERRYFFNSGGWVSFDAGLTGGNSVAGDQTQTYPNSPAYQKDEIWQTMLNTMGSIRFTRTGTASTGSGTGTSIGNYGLTGSYQTIFTKSGSGVYSENSYTVEARNEGSDGNKVRFRIKFNDADVGDNRDADDGFPGEGTPVDENVTGTITSNVSTRAATGVLNISHPSGVQISTLEGALSTSYTLTSSATSTDEGTTVSVTMTTTGVSNGTNVSYAVTGISAADLSSGSLTGNFNIQSNTATVNFGIANDATTEGTETMTITSGGQSLDIDINDTSKGAVYSLSPSAQSVNEGSTVTFTLDTEFANPGNYAYTITGINAADLSSGSLTGTLTTSGSYTSATGSIDITLSNDATSEGTETITFNVAGLSTNVTVNDTSASSVSGWPTQPLGGAWGTNFYQQSSSGGNYTAQSFATLNVTNDFSNSRVTLAGYTGDNGATATVNTGYITYSGYSNPTIEVRYFQSNVSINSVGDTDSWSPATQANPYAASTWYTITNNQSRQFDWQANELRYNQIPQGDGGGSEASVASVNADNVSFEVRISESGKPTITRTSPVKSVRLTADLYTGQLQ